MKALTRVVEGLLKRLPPDHTEVYDAFREAGLSHADALRLAADSGDPYATLLQFDERINAIVESVTRAALRKLDA